MSTDCRSSDCTDRLSPAGGSQRTENDPAAAETGWFGDLLCGFMAKLYKDILKEVEKETKCASMNIRTQWQKCDSKHSPEMFAFILDTSSFCSAQLHHRSACATAGCTGYHPVS